MKVSKNRVRTNQIPRQVPKQSLYTKSIPGNNDNLPMIEHRIVFLFKLC
jgi:hypothetical protein